MSKAPELTSPLAAMLCREEAARYIGVAVATMADWAHRGTHRKALPVARIGKRRVLSAG